MLGLHMVPDIDPCWRLVLLTNGALVAFHRMLHHILEQIIGGTKCFS